MWPSLLQCSLVYLCFLGGVVKFDSTLYEEQFVSLLGERIAKVGQ